MEDDEFEAAGDAEDSMLEDRMLMSMVLVMLPSEGLGGVW